MLKKISRGWWVVIIIVAAIVIDQIIKIWVKTSFYIGEDYQIFSWFHLRFVQNNGMAFGMEVGPKLFLTLFRLIVVAILIWYIARLLKNPRTPMGYIVTLAVITAGAAGNIFDCLFYGEIFNNPGPREVAKFVPWGDGYSGLFSGLVVDMFYFPLFSFQWPAWMPFVGGETFSFFDPVFNFADALICVGIFILIFKYYKYLGGDKVEDKKDKTEKKGKKSKKEESENINEKDSATPVESPTDEAEIPDEQ